MSAQSQYTRSLTAWLENVIPKPDHVDPEMEAIYGDNPMRHLCPIIAEYLGANPYYFIPDTDSLNLKDPIKRHQQERDNTFELYDGFFAEQTTQQVGHPIIPTCFPQYDAMVAPICDNMPVFGYDHPHQLYLKQLYQSHFQYAKSYTQRYLPAMSQNQVQTFSITNLVILADKSMMFTNENNLILWPAKYLEPNDMTDINLQNNEPIYQNLSIPSAMPTSQRAPTKSTTTKTRDDAPMTNAKIMQHYSLKPAYYNTHLVPQIEAHLRNCWGNASRKSAKVHRTFPHLLHHPIFFNSYDVAANSFNPDIMLQNLPHQLIKDPNDDLYANLRQKSECFEESDIDDEDSEDSASCSYSDDEESEDGYTTSEEDSDSQDEGYSLKKGKNKDKKSRKIISCPNGHAMYTAICAIPPLFHVSPANDILLKKFGISLHSTRLFATGCQHGHLTLHDGWTGFSHTIGRTKHAIVGVQLITTHQHYSKCNLEELKRSVTFSPYPSQLSKSPQPQTQPQSTNGLCTGMNQLDINKTTSLADLPIDSNIFYNDKTRLFPIIAAIDQVGIVTLWNAIDGAIVTRYSQESADLDEQHLKYLEQQKTGKKPAEYNITGVLRMPLLTIPLLPGLPQRLARYETMTQSLSAYSTPHTSSISAIMHNTHNILFKLQKSPKYKPQVISSEYTIHYNHRPTPWCPFGNFEFHKAYPRLNGGSMYQLTDPDIPHFNIPHAHFYADGTNPSTNPVNTVYSIYQESFVAPSVLVSSYRGGQLSLCDMTNMTHPSFFTFAHKQHISCFAYIGGLLWTAGWDCTVKSWDLRYLASPLHTVHIGDRNITAICGLEDRYLVVACADKTLRVYDIDQLAINHTYIRQVLQDLELYLQHSNYNELMTSLYPTFAQERTNETNDPAQFKPVHFAKVMTPSELLIPEYKISSPYMVLLPIYPNVLCTQLAHLWLIKQRLTYNGRDCSFYPILTAEHANPTHRQPYSTNLLSPLSNNGIYVPLAKNYSQRLDSALNACIFDWDVDDLIQTIVPVNGVLITASKDNKTKVGVNNKHMGGVETWATSVDLSDLMQQ